VRPGEKINVLFIQSQSSFGADSMIHSLIMGGLDRRRFTVHVACARGSEGLAATWGIALAAVEKIPDVRIRPTNFGPSTNAHTKREVAREAVVEGMPAVVDLVGLVRYARRHHIQIVHGTEKPRDAFYGLLLARLIGAKAITHLHVKFEDWISPLTRWAMKHDDALIGVSEYVAGTMVANGYAASRTSWVLNSIDASKLDPTIDSTAVRREFGLRPDVPVISSISRLFPWKGHRLLLEALAKVSASGQPFKLVVVGEDDPRATPGGGSFLAEIKKLTSDLELDDKVIFAGFRQDVSAILAASDIFAMPSFEEPFGVVFLEAMTMGKPVVALRNGGTPEVVAHGETGLLSEPDDVDGLATNLAQLLADPEARARMGALGRKRVDEYFTPRRLAADIEQVYDRVLGLGCRP
jgi:glycosyltransferase involved in cell wall biosynthesis